jgi:hypothetical protein
MESFRNILLSFTLGFGTISLLVDTNPDVIQAKFTAIMAIILITVLSSVYETHKKSKKDLDK